MIEYIVPNFGERYPDDATELPDGRDNSPLRELGRLVGDHLFHQRQGYEAAWPLTFEVYRNRTKLAVLEVDLEAEPVFIVKVKEPAQ